MCWYLIWARLTSGFIWLMAQLFNKVSFNPVSLFLQHRQRVRLSLDVSVFRFICCKTMLVYATGLLDRDFKWKIRISVGLGPEAWNGQTLNSFWMCICFTYGAGARLNKDFPRRTKAITTIYSYLSRVEQTLGNFRVIDSNCMLCQLTVSTGISKIIVM